MAPVRVAEATSPGRRTRRFSQLIEFAAEYGFGISTLGAENLNSNSHSVDMSALDDYVDAMGEVERRAFEVAYGAQPFDSTLNRGSCTEQANAARSNSVASRRNQAFSQALIDFLEVYQADERVVQANRAYSACMALDGYSFGSRDEATAAIGNRFFEWISLGGPATQGPAGGAAVVDSLTASSRNALRRIQQEEVEIAKASIRCEAPIRPALIEATVELETRWLAEHGERLLEEIAQLDQ